MLSDFHNLGSDQAIGKRALTARGPADQQPLGHQSQVKKTFLNKKTRLQGQKALLANPLRQLSAAPPKSLSFRKARERYGLVNSLRRC